MNQQNLKQAIKIKNQKKYQLDKNGILCW